MNAAAFESWLLCPDRPPLVMGILNVTPDRFKEFVIPSEDVRYFFTSLYPLLLRLLRLFAAKFSGWFSAHIMQNPPSLDTGVTIFTGKRVAWVGMLRPTLNGLAAKGGLEYVTTLRTRIKRALQIRTV